MKKHWADKFILRELFWFLVLPHSLKKYVKSRNIAEQGDGGGV